jgi:hypothetical protein
MIRIAPLALGVVFGCLSLGLVAHAQDRGKQVHRAPPPAFQAHAPGVHPRGATVHSHQVRVLAPSTVVHGHASWRHWSHPEFARPNYYWDWGHVHTVTCVAEDSYGDQYPVSEAATPGFGLDNMTDVEDDSLDRCYSESGQDSTCVLATCSHI